MKEMKILIIEDEMSRNIIRSLRYVIPDFQAFVATNKSEALELLNSEDFDLITLDGQLLDDDHGRDVLKEMTDKQIFKTLVYSADSKFLNECQNAGIKTLDKSDRSIVDVISLSADKESIEINVK